MAFNEFADYIRVFRPIMEGIKAIFGDRAEFILHDLSTHKCSVAAVVGNITNRAVGAPTTNVVMEALKKYGDEAEDMIGYRSVSRDGRVLKSSTIFIRNEASKVVGCLCYNIDLTDFAIAENLIKSFGLQSEDEYKNMPNEVFAQDLNDVVEDIITTEINQIGKPVPMMSRTEKLAIVATLESKDIFNVKGTTEIVAKCLGSSVFTIYNYLKEIRNNK